MNAYARFGLLIPLLVLLGACFGTGDEAPYFARSRYGNDAAQPFPANYKAELLAFLKTYLNDPVGVREASMAEPVQRTVGSRLRYISCVRYNARESDGSYRGTLERGVVFVDGRLDRIIENAGEACAGAAYAPFPEMQNLTR